VQAVPSEIFFFGGHLRNGILVALFWSRHRPTEYGSRLSSYSIYASQPSNIIMCGRGVSKSLCHLSWSKVGLAIALLDITQHVNRASVGTAYAWYTGVIKRKASREKKWLRKAHLSDNEMV
jgi:hypothetical protein